MFAKIENNAITKWPCSFQEVKSSHKNMSIPSSIDGEDLLQLGYLRFEYTLKGDFDPEYQEAVEITPVIKNGKAIQRWEIRELYSESEKQRLISEQEIKNELDKEESNRSHRNHLLADSDWTQMNDSPLTNEVKTAWATYRQELRDLSDLDAWPNLDDADWPVAP